MEKIGKQEKKPVPKWFYAAVFALLMMAFGLSMPFWGDRPGHERPWLTMGHLYALLYFFVAAGVIYVMAQMYGSGDKEDFQSELDDDEFEMPSRNKEKHNGH
ncbi:MAG: hypothetical protein Q9M31_05460 [Mariprofundus sp.]|nr:hypothetical protein [Mariprofundus sp.]